MPSLQQRAMKAGIQTKPVVNGNLFTENSTVVSSEVTGYGLGPEWMTKSHFKSTFKPSISEEGYLQVSINVLRPFTILNLVIIIVSLRTSCLCIQ